MYTRSHHASPKIPGPQRAHERLISALWAPIGFAALRPREARSTFVVYTDLLKMWQLYSAPPDWPRQIGLAISRLGLAKEMYSNWVKIGGKRREIMWDQKSQHHYVVRRNGQEFTVTGAVGSLGKF